jgi:serine/arginine repetitive matrix protein 1
LRRRKQRKKLAARRSKSKRAKGSWKKSGEENASIAIGAGEVVAVGAETSIDGHTGTIDRHPGDEAASDFVIHPQGESLILTFPQVRAGAVGRQGRRAPLPPALVPFPHLDPHLVDAYQAETDTGINVAARRVAPSLQKEETTGDREDAVQTTVIELDPFPAVIHRAHVLPEETEGDENLSLRAVHLVHLLPETGAKGTTDPVPGQGLGRESRMRRATDGGDPHLIPQELTRMNQPLILQRPASPVMIAV